MKLEVDEKERRIILMITAIADAKPEKGKVEPKYTVKDPYFFILRLLPYLSKTTKVQPFIATHKQLCDI